MISPYKRPIALKRKLPEPIPMRPIETQDFPTGRSIRQYHNEEYNISMIATKNSHTSKFSVRWMCGDLDESFDSYALLKKAWEDKINGNTNKRKPRKYFKGV